MSMPVDLELLTSGVLACTFKGVINKHHETVAHGWTAPGKCPQHVSKLCPACGQVTCDRGQDKKCHWRNREGTRNKSARLCACRATEFLMVRKRPGQVA